STTVPPAIWMSYSAMRQPPFRSHDSPTEGNLESNTPDRAGLAGRPGVRCDNRMRLADKVAIITGAGSGVGRAASLLFAREGASVVAAGRTLSKVEETSRLVENEGGRCVPVRCDVAVSADVQAMIESATRAFGALHVIVNNAGVGYSSENELSMQDVVNTSE